MYSLEQRVIICIRNSCFFYGFGIMYFKWNANAWNYIFFLLTSKRNVLILNFKFGFCSPVRRRNIIHPNRTFLLLSSDNFQTFLHRHYTKELKSCLPHTGKMHKFPDFHCERYSANHWLPLAQGGRGCELEASGLQSPTKSGFTKHMYCRANDIKISRDSPTAEISH